MFSNFGLVRAITLVFFASACTMVIELVAGRILAPYIGVSLYTWTSIIGVVLAGISVGNYLGGKLGDRFPSPLVLSIIFFAGAIFCLTILPITGVLRLTPLPNSVHIMSRSTIYTFGLFFLPTAFLGMVTPIVIKLTLKELHKTAGVVGTIYAISCVGSILGTFLTGFFLISWFGTRAVVWQVAGILFLLAILASSFWTSKLKLGAMAATFVVFVLVFQFKDVYQVSYLRESNYYTVRVYDVVEKGRQVKALALDHLIHSFVDLNDPTFHVYDYEKTFAALAAYIAWYKPDMKTLHIGGGGYTMPRYLEVTYPEASVEVIEIDPAVTETAYSDLGLPADSRVVSYNRDARFFFIDQKPKDRYDLVFGDAFNDTSVPYHLTTLEFNEEIRESLTPNGIYTVNLIDNLKEGRFVRSFMKTLKQSFKQVYLVLTPDGLKFGGTSTYVILATNGNFSTSEFAALLKSNPEEYGFGGLVTFEEAEQALGSNPAIVLTDDYVPVDNMLAPLFTAR